MIILANVYGIEKQTHMEEIIYATKYTKKKIFQAKFIAGIFISIGMALLTLITSGIVGYILLPMHSLSMPVMELGSRIQTGLFSVHMTYWQLYVIVIGLLIMGFVGMGVVSLLVSYFFKNQFQVIIILIFGLFSSVFLQYTSLLQNTALSLPLMIRSLLPHSMCYNQMLVYVFGTSVATETPFVFGIIPLWAFAIGVWIIIMLMSYILISLLTKNSYVWRSTHVFIDSK